MGGSQVNIPSGHLKRAERWGPSFQKGLCAFQEKSLPLSASFPNHFLFLIICSLRIHHIHAKPAVTMLVTSLTFFFFLTWVQKIPTLSELSVRYQFGF